MTIPLQFVSLHYRQKAFVWSSCLLGLGTDFLVSVICILIWSSTVRVHDSQAYRKMDVTRERISRILEMREILLTIQFDFSLVNAAVVCAILESISGLKLSSVVTEPWYLKLVTV